MTARPTVFRGYFPVGICCPACGHATRIVDKRGRRDGSVWRRHQCIMCATRVTTYERVEYKKAS